MMPNSMMAVPQLMQNLQQLKTNPLQFLVRRGFNIPSTVGTDPNAILQYLVQSEQISQDQMNWAYQMAGRFRR